MATPRETLKYYFRKYALPTEQQFAELIDAFVHKDEDMLTQEKIDGLSAALQSKVSSETLEQYKAEVQTMIDNATTGGSNISDRLDTAEDNIAGHELRIKALEQAEGVTIDEYLSNTSENPVQNKTVFSALEEKANQTEFQSLKEKIDTFLEDTDATDETINKWKEIESFLQGITDQETLTGLLSDLKAEIIALIPEPEPAQQGNFVKQIADLDGYSEAQDGEIVQYVGQTSENYTRGFFYERKAGDAKETLRLSDTPSTYNGGDVLEKSNESITIDKYYGYYAIAPVQQGNYMYDSEFKSYNVSSLTGDSPKYITLKKSNGVSLGSGPLEEGVTCPIFIDQNNKKYFRISDSENWLVEISDDLTQLTGTIKATITKDSTPSSASWQVIPVGPCVG